MKKLNRTSRITRTWVKKRDSVETVVQTMSISGAIVALRRSRLSASNAKIAEHGLLVNERRCDVLDEEQVDNLVTKINDMFTPEEVTEILGVTVNQLLDKFRDEALEIDWDLVL